MTTPAHTDTVVIGAGAAGLAVGACLRRVGREAVMLERDEEIGGSWRHRYERLHLHTDRDRSELPYRGFDPDVPRYPSRLDVAEYLERYAEHHGLAPRLGVDVRAVRRTPEGWRVRTTAGDWLAPHVVVATGHNGRPVRPELPGREGFPGPVIHSGGYRSGAPFRGRRVLVVGCGNSGGEIALDLHEHGARPSLVVRSPVSVIPRDLFGMPILAIAIPLSRLPVRLADAIAGAILRVVMGDLEAIGLPSSREGPFRTIAERDRIPLIDVGTVDLVRRGLLPIRPGVRRFEGNRVVFEDGGREPYDAVVLATGFRPAFAGLFEDPAAVADERGVPRRDGVRGPLPGLWFCGFDVTATGMLREIGREAMAIADEIAGDG